MTIIIWTLTVLVGAGTLWLMFRQFARAGVQTHSAAERLALIGTLKQQLTELDAGLADGTLMPEQYERSRIELEKRLLTETENSSPNSKSRRLVLPVISILLTTLFAVSLYILIAKPRLFTIMFSTPAEESMQAAHPMTPEQVQLMITRLAKRLKDNPDDFEGWATLGRSYTSLKRFDEAVGAFGKADALQPHNAQFLADYADAAAMAQGKRFEGKPTELIQRALKVDQNNVKTLTLAGSAAFDAGAYEQAVTFWQRVLQQVPPESEIASALKANIADASRRGGLKAAPLVSNQSGIAGPSATVKGRVSLIAELATKVSPNDTVFIFARAVDGPTMPLAVVKRRVKDLPINFTFDDTMAPSPEMQLSKFKVVDVAARISKTGSVTTQHGDLVAPATRVLVGGATVEVTIQGEVR